MAQALIATRLPDVMAQRFGQAHNTPPYGRPPTLEPTAFRANYRGGRWFESTAAHTNSIGLSITQAEVAEP